MLCPADKIMCKRRPRHRWRRTRRGNRRNNVPCRNACIDGRGNPGETGTVAENGVSDIYVLAFDKATGNLVYKSKGKNLTTVSSSQNSNTHSFTATLPVGMEYNFIVLANAENKLSGINIGTGKTKSDVLALTKSETSKWDYTTPFVPMWGEQDLNLTASDTPTFELTWMLARVNVEVKLREDAQGTPRDNFKLTSVRYYNYNTAGTLVPAPGNYDTDAKKATAPTIPASPGTKTGEALVYDDAVKEISGGTSCTETIYIFEAAHNGSTYTSPANNIGWIDNPCLVIGGIYTTDSGEVLEETFYRVDFIKKQDDGNGQITDQWLDVLRNFSYNVSIVEVSGSGFPDPDTALKSAPINMEAIILEWDEGEMGEIVFDGVFYLSVSRDEFVFERGKVDTEQEEYVLYVKTDYVYNNNPSDANSGWYVEKYVDAADGTTPVNWLQLNPERGAPDDKVKAYFTFEENPNNTNRSAIVWIAAGRLRYPVYITQKVLSLYITDPEDNNNPVSEMFFVVPTSLNPQSPRKFEVTWTPVDHNVDITTESPEEWNPFEPDWLFPNPSPSWQIAANPSGKESYTITPPTVNQSMINTDPFYQKETTYNFTVSNGSDSETKGITLHQIYYNIIVDTYTYRLDGKTYTLNVRSNTDWVITKIEEWLYNTEPDPANPYPSPIMLDLNNYDNLRIGTTGGPNISGEAVSFTVVDENAAIHKGKWGVIRVTFENPDGKFEPYTATLHFPKYGLSILALGYARDVRAYSAGFPSTYHNQGAYRVLNESWNFGNLVKDDKRSTVMVDGMKIHSYNATGTPRSSSGTDPGTNWVTGFFRNWLNDHSPDIIICSSTMTFTAEDAALLKQYLDHGGAVLLFYGGGITSNQNAGNSYDLMNAIFADEGVTFSSSSATNTSRDFNYRSSSPASGAIFQLEDVDDPILTGSFGDVRNGYWGTHYYRLGLKRDKIEHLVHPLSYTDNQLNNSAATVIDGYINMFRHKTLNLFWVGNGSFFASYYPSIDENGHDPFRNDNDHKPILRENFGGYGGAPRADVCNSIIFANAVEWAIGVTQHNPPVGGY